jgi:ATP-dependent Lon protease
MPTVQLDKLDQIAVEAFPGYIVRKDLALQFKGRYPVPTYVGEFLLGKYCATTDEREIEEGLQIVERQMSQRTVRAGEEEYHKSQAREEGAIRIIDLVTARLDAKTDSYVAQLPSLQLNDVRITPPEVTANERLLTGGRQQPGDGRMSVTGREEEHECSPAGAGRGCSCLTATPATSPPRPQ